MRSISREAVSKSYVTSLSGPLNVNRSEYVVQLFRDLSERGIKRVVVNLEDVPFIDSHGLGALIAGYKIFGRNPQNFRLAGIQDQPLLVFELTGFDRVFGTSEYVGERMAETTAAQSHIQAGPGRSKPAFVPAKPCCPGFASLGVR